MQTDEKWMRRALTLAARAWGMTSPNPLVGAVVVRDGVAVGEGWHHRAGEPHAEVHALNAAGGSARDATLYVTLEPCSTQGRTPPCVDAVLRAGIRRVVVAVRDPNPRHAGRGLERLRTAGVEVVESSPAIRSAATTLNESFFCWIRFGRPFVTLKLAGTLDGRIATAAGQSQWITGPAARRHVQKMRRWCDAIMVGGETVRRDNPQLLVREPATWQRQPLRLIATRSGDLGTEPHVLTDGRAPTRLVHAESPEDWRALIAGLGREQVTALLVEGGGELAASLLAAGVVDKLALFFAPRLLGGRGSRPLVGGPDPLDLADAHALSDTRVQRVGDDFLFTGYLTDVHRNY